MYACRNYQAIINEKGENLSYIFTTLIIWITIWYLVDLLEWRNYYPTIIFTALLGIVSDLYGVVFNQWTYYGPTVGGLSLWSVLGIAPAEGGLYIRLFPKSKNVMIKVGYLVFWAVLNTLGELFFVKAGWIGYIQWNPFRAFIYYLFFFGAIWLQEYWYNGTGRTR